MAQLEGKKTWKNHIAIYDTRIYKIWTNMKQRCNNPNNTHYKDYGGKGVGICREWNDIKAFMEWSFKNGYEETLTIDRIDGTSNYSPNNCRWVTRKVQSHNLKNNRNIVINGVSKCVSEWAETSGISKNTLYKRLGLGWKDSELLKPIDRRFSNVG